MNKRIFLIALAIISVGFLYKRSLRSMESSSSSSSATQPMITLVSSDGQQFQISHAVAEQSLMMQAALQSGMREGKTGVITLQETPADILQKMVNILNQLPHEANIDNLVINTFVKPDGTCDMPTLLAIAKTSDYLQINPLTDSILRLYIFQFLKTNRNTTIEGLEANIPFAHASLENLFDSVKSSAGFIALDVKAHDEQGLYDRGKVSIRLDNKKIKNVYGLSFIQRAKDITWLALHDNLLTELPADSFIGFPKLLGLMLSKNTIIELSEDTFKGLSNLDHLDLSRNLLKTLPSNIFRPLINLGVLDLNSNYLTKLPDGIFDALTHLRILLLQFNPQLHMNREQIRALLPENVRATIGQIAI